MTTSNSHSRRHSSLDTRRDLHDRVGPVVSSLALRVAMIRQNLEGGATSGVTQALSMTRSLEEDLTEVVEDVRDALRPTGMRRTRLSEVLRRRVAGLNQARDAEWVHLRTDGDLGRLPSSVQAEVVMVVSEALNNAARHADARQVWVRIHRGQQGLDLSIADDGTYRDPARSSGLGVRSMRNRIERLGGTFTLTRRPQGGTLIRATVPRPDER